MATEWCICQAGADTTATTSIRHCVETYASRTKDGEVRRCIVCDRQVAASRNTSNYLWRSQ